MEEEGALECPGPAMTVLDGCFGDTNGEVDSWRTIFRRLEQARWNGSSEK